MWSVASGTIVVPCAVLGTKMGELGACRREGGSEKCGKACRRHARCGALACGIESGVLAASDRGCVARRRTMRLDSAWSEGGEAALCDNYNID
ncbi:hypothetical protein RO07_16315 [Pandoraea pulmonicola]|uniref:Uncharacterized protein n=2 Tax=Pandoraea pulmonicola TaxID=93221 RepID=A0ABM5S1N8_PANPU|nr:hypothetical protein RO07_16315 [Pandoraea pulmonicola]